MKDIIWAKTSLSVYRYLERICGSIDKMVESSAMASFYVCSNNYASSNITNVADKIIALTERKKTLINLKVLVDKSLKNCDHLYARLLIEKYIDGDKSNDIAERHNLPMRSYFRKLGKAEENFADVLAQFGYNDKKMSKFLAGEKWIGEVYYRYASMSEGEGAAKKDVFSSISERNMPQLAQ